MRQPLLKFQIFALLNVAVRKLLMYIAIAWIDTFRFFQKGTVDARARENHFAPIEARYHENSNQQTD
jgi:hypothetical protein